MNTPNSLTLKRLAQKAKHYSYIGIKKSNHLSAAAGNVLLDRYFHALEPLTDYRFDPSRYRRSFILREDHTHMVSPENIPAEVPRVAYAFWTGNNPLTPNRAKNIDAMEEILGVPVKLITPDNLDEFLVEGFPLHPSYEKLSLVHRSDYLRAYLAAYKGGMYVDVKRPKGNVAGLFAQFDQNPQLWFLGTKHHHNMDVAHMSGKLGWDLKKFHQRIPANGHFIARAATPMALEWMREVNRLLDYFAPQLETFPGNVVGDVVGYPISWNRLLNQVHHPLCLKYLEHTQVTDELGYPEQQYR
ncbi:hypothetical protein VVR12_09600 [Rothia sp. LK2588]|uniref:hypothetical protein n=1 Tax=Rothia sp. LK2588 TaxID=3114369 RepID=UPI0034CE9DC1